MKIVDELMQSSYIKKTFIYDLILTVISVYTITNQYYLVGLVMFLCGFPWSYERTF